MTMIVTMNRIAICAPSRSITADDAARVSALAADYPGLDLQFHPQCFLEHGHFAGTDQQRLDALVECANDPGFDAVWFARGGYGSNRIAEDALAQFNSSAQHKTFLGYSDAGYLLGGLYARKIGHPVHASMPADLRRDGGEAAVRRVWLSWLGIMPGWNRRWMIIIPGGTFLNDPNEGLDTFINGKRIPGGGAARRPRGSDRSFADVGLGGARAAAVGSGRIGDRV